MGTEAFYPVALLIGYVLGSIPFGLVLTRLAGTPDGNFGASVASWPADRTFGTLTFG